MQHVVSDVVGVSNFKQNLLVGCEPNITREP